MTTPDVLPAEPPFLGQSRIRLVDGLLAILAEAEARREARWVSLEAPSGWGKTRVAQVLYARLAVRPDPGADSTGPSRYWPATILEATDASPGDVASRRKRVFPDPAHRFMTLAAEPVIAPRCLRVCHDRPAPPPFPPGAGLDALAPADLAELVRAYHPHTDPETLARLAARFNNPLPLELICTLPKYRRTDAQDGALRLEPADIERLPRRVEDIYRALWEELPEPAQQALALATLAIPDGDAAWHRAITARSIADCLEIPAHEALGETLAQDRVPHGWVRALADWQRRFNEPDQLAIAATARNEHFLADDLDRVLDRLAAALVAHPLADPDPEAQHCARLLLSLHRQSGGTEPGRVSDSDALRAVRLLQQSYADQPHELPARIALGRILDGLRVDADSLNLLEARADYAMALGESGRVEAAEAALSALLVDQTRVLGSDHPCTLGTRSNIAYCRAESGEISAALKDFAAVLADQKRILGPDHPDTLSTRFNIAAWRAESGKFAAALTEFETLLANQERILDPADPDLQRTRDWIAGLRNRLDRRKPPRTGDHRKRRRRR